MVFELYHWSVLYWVVASIGLLMVIEFTKLFSDLLNFLVIIILLDFTVLVVCISTHAHASIYLHCSDSLSSQETSNVGLDLDQESQLSSTHSLR